MKAFLWVIVMILIVTCIYAGAVTFQTYYPMRPPYLQELIEDFTDLDFRPIDFGLTIEGLERIFNERVVEFDGALGALINGVANTGSAIFYIVDASLSLLTDLIYNALLAFKFVGAMFRLRPVVYALLC